jgi:hypothetical protein
MFLAKLAHSFDSQIVHIFTELCNKINKKFIKAGIN